MFGHIASALCELHRPRIQTPQLQLTLLAPVVFSPPAQDPICSPHVDAARAAAGAAFERILADHLSAARVAFQSEERLRALQYAKTPVRGPGPRPPPTRLRRAAPCPETRSGSGPPYSAPTSPPPPPRTRRNISQDARLEVPILVHGRVVHWIDSKASFGDPHVHREQGMRQFLSYVNRYGPGLVIYWMGFVDELDSHPEARAQFFLGRLTCSVAFCREVWG